MQHLEQDETLLHVVDDVGNDEEEVEIFPARSSSSTRVSVHSSDRLSLTPLAQRRCVSKEMLEQMPTLSIDARYHDVAVCKPFGCFYLMQLIEKSIQVGALFSPKLYVPKEVWQQDRVRLAGISLKVEVFHQLKQGLERISHALPILSDSANAAFVKELDALLELAGQERMHLTRLFPFLPQDKSDLTPQMRRRASSSEVEVGSTETSSSGIYIGKLTNLAFGFGRMVKKQAISAVERVGAAPIISVSIHELDEYAAVLCMFFNSTRSIENLLGLQADADGAQEQVNDAPTEVKSAQLDSATLKKLKIFAIFLDEVVIELVMRDVQTLLELYMRRLTRQFGEFTIKPTLIKRRPSVTT